MTTEEFRDKLIEIISQNNLVLGTGQTGDLHAPLVPGQSDIDMFVICSKVPTKEERMKMY